MNRSSLSHREYLWGIHVSNFGNWLASLALLAWVYSITGSYLWLSGAMILQRLPAIFGANLLFHRLSFSPRRSLIGIDLLRLLTQASIGIVTLTGWDSMLQIQAVLVLTTVRSFVTGPEAGLRSELLELHFSGTELRSALPKVQIGSLGLTGALASLVYFFLELGDHRFSKIAFIDATTFLISAALLVSAKHLDISRSSTVLRAVWSPLRVLLNSPWVLPRVLLHSVRMVVVGYLFQFTLSIGKNKYGLDDRYTGLFYLTPTLGWLIPAWLSSRFKVKLPTSSYILGHLGLSILLAISVYARMPLETALTILFLAWAIDGLLLADIASYLQLASRRGEAGVLNNAFNILSVIVLVSGYFIVGLLNEWVGVTLSIYIGTLSLAFLAVVIWILIAIEPECFLLLSCNRILRKHGYRLRSYSSEDAYTDCLRLDRTVSVRVSDIVTRSALFRGSSVNLEKKASWAAAICEAIERASVQADLYSHANEVRTNGVAAHFHSDKAEQAARLELMERDSILYHQVYELPPTCRIHEKTENGNSYHFFQLRSGTAGIFHFACLFETESCFALGWGTGTLAEQALKKARMEALSSAFTHLNVERGKESRSENQIRLVLDTYTRKDLEFLFKAPLLSGPLEYTEVDLSLVDYNEIRIDQIPSICPELVTVVRANCDRAFVPKWPCLEREAIIATATLKGLSTPIQGDRLDKPCIVY